MTLYKFSKKKILLFTKFVDQDLKYITQISFFGNLCNIIRFIICYVLYMCHVYKLICSHMTLSYVLFVLPIISLRVYYKIKTFLLISFNHLHSLNTTKMSNIDYKNDDSNAIASTSSLVHVIIFACFLLFMLLHYCKFVT